MWGGSRQLTQGPRGYVRAYAPTRPRNRRPSRRQTTYDTVVKVFGLKYYTNVKEDFDSKKVKKTFCTRV